MFLFFNFYEINTFKYTSLITTRKSICTKYIMLLLLEIIYGIKDMT